MTTLDALTDPYVLTALTCAGIVAWATVLTLRGYRIF